MAGDESSPAEAAATQALVNSIMAVLGTTPITLSEDDVRQVWALLTATQREWTTAATRRQTDRLRAANEEIDSLGYILVGKRADMNQLLCNVNRKQAWINALEERVLEKEVVVESQRRCIEEIESVIRDLMAVCDAVCESDVSDTREGEDEGNPCLNEISKKLPNSARVLDKIRRSLASIQTLLAVSQNDQSLAVKAPR